MRRYFERISEVTLKALNNVGFFPSPGERKRLPAITEEGRCPRKIGILGRQVWL